MDTLTDYQIHMRLLNARALVQLPDNAKPIGLRRKREFNSFEFDAVYATPEMQGTQWDFLRAGKAYAYVPVDKFTRRAVNVV